MNGMMAWLILGIILTGVIKRVNCAEAMLSGVREGMDTAVRILPSLVCMMTAIGCFRASGLMDKVIALLLPVFGWMNLPGETLPLLLVRPLSGSASTAMVKELMDIYGPDSPQTVAGCVLCSSGETLFYVLSVYTGACGVKNTRYTVPAALFAWLCGAIAAAGASPLGM